MNMKLLGLAGLLMTVVLSAPALADTNSDTSTGSTPPAANGNPPPAQGGSYPHQDIHNDAQNYREAMDATPNNNPQMSNDDMKARREHWREEQKARREHWREEHAKHRQERKDQHKSMMPGGAAPQGGMSPQDGMAPQGGMSPQGGNMPAAGAVAPAAPVAAPQGGTPGVMAPQQGH